MYSDCRDIAAGKQLNPAFVKDNFYSKLYIPHLYFLAFNKFYIKDYLLSI